MTTKTECRQEFLSLLGDFQDIRIAINHLSEAAHRKKADPGYPKDEIAMLYVTEDTWDGYANAVHKLRPVFMEHYDRCLELLAAGCSDITNEEVEYWAASVQIEAGMSFYDAGLHAEALNLFLAACGALEELENKVGYPESLPPEVGGSLNGQKWNSVKAYALLLINNMTQGDNGKLQEISPRLARFIADRAKLIYDQQYFQDYRELVAALVQAAELCSGYDMKVSVEIFKDALVYMESDPSSYTERKLKDYVIEGVRLLSMSDQSEFNNHYFGKTEFLKGKRALL